MGERHSRTRKLFFEIHSSKNVNEPSEWTKKLGTAQYILNNTFHKSINTTPSKLLLGYDQRNTSDKILQPRGVSLIKNLYMYCELSEILSNSI